MPIKTPAFLNTFITLLDTHGLHDLAHPKIALPTVIFSISKTLSGGGLQEFGTALFLGHMFPDCPTDIANAIKGSAGFTNGIIMLVTRTPAIYKTVATKFKSAGAVTQQNTYTLTQTQRFFMAFFKACARIYNFFSALHAGLGTVTLFGGTPRKDSVSGWFKLGAVSLLGTLNFGCSFISFYAYNLQKLNKNALEFVNFFSTPNSFYNKKTIPTIVICFGNIISFLAFSSYATRTIIETITLGMIYFWPSLKTFFATNGFTYTADAFALLTAIPALPTVIFTYAAGVYHFINSKEKLFSHGLPSKKILAAMSLIGTIGVINTAYSAVGYFASITVLLEKLGQFIPALSWQIPKLAIASYGALSSVFACWAFNEHEALKLAYALDKKNNEEAKPLLTDTPLPSPSSADQEIHIAIQQEAVPVSTYGTINQDFSNSSNDLHLLVSENSQLYFNKNNEKSKRYNFFSYLVPRSLSESASNLYGRFQCC